VTSSTLKDAVVYQAKVVLIFSSILSTKVYMTILLKTHLALKKTVESGRPIENATKNREMATKVCTTHHPRGGKKNGMNGKEASPLFKRKLFCPILCSGED